MARDDENASGPASGRQPWGVPPRESTEDTLPQAAGGYGPAAPTVVRAPGAAWSAPVGGWPATGPASGQFPAVGPGYGHPAPQGWTPPPAADPAAHHAAPPAGGVRWEQPYAPAPGPRRRKGGVLLVVLVAALVLGAGAGTWYLVSQPDEGSSSADGAAPDGPGGSAPAPAEVGTAKEDAEPADPDRGGSPTPSSSAAPPADPEAEAVALMDALAAEGRAAVSLDGRWVAQLASKSVGTTDPLQVAANGTHVFRGTDILAEHQGLEQLVGGSAYVFVLHSTDFGRISTDDYGRPYWVTLADAAFGSREEVLAFCAQTFPTLTVQELANACVPRTLEPSHP